MRLAIIATFPEKAYELFVLSIVLSVLLKSRGISIMDIKSQTIRVIKL